MKIISNDEHAKLILGSKNYEKVIAKAIELNQNFQAESIQLDDVLSVISTKEEQPVEEETIEQADVNEENIQTSEQPAEEHDVETEITAEENPTREELLSMISTLQSEVATLQQTVQDLSNGTPAKSASAGKSDKEPIVEEADPFKALFSGTHAEKKENLKKIGIL